MDLSEILTELKKQKDDGKKIVGIFAHQMIPEELIHASGAIPLRLGFWGSEEICMKGTDYLSAATCPLARSTVGLFEEKNEFYSLIDVFIGGNYCNGDVCASEYISKYFDVPLIHFPIPWMNNSSSIHYYQSIISNLKKSLEKIFELKIADEQILNSIDLYNRIRKNFQEITVKIGMGSQFQILLNNLYLLGPDLFTQNVKMEENNVEKKLNHTAIAFTGSYVSINDLILETIENCGLDIRYNDSESIFYFDELLPSGEPLATLAQYYLQNNYSSRMLETQQRIDRIISKVKSLGLNGTILHVLKFCDPYIATRNEIKDSLDEHGYAVLEIERDYDQSIEQLKTRIEAFREMIE
ncbi:MAG: 2-hydroxyacyl-CoA dehydratase subunit D [Candidatus Hodarchaeota archaeon]